MSARRPRVGEKSILELRHARSRAGAYCLIAPDFRVRVMLPAIDRGETETALAQGGDDAFQGQVIL